jgi:Spy/CpxP family protein refolding chaperone
VKSNRQVRAVKTSAQAEHLDAVQAALRAADEIAAALQAHLTQEHGAHIEDRSHTVAPTLDLLRHARERIAAGLRDAREQEPRSDGLEWPALRSSNR